MEHKCISRSFKTKLALTLQRYKMWHGLSSDTRKTSSRLTSAVLNIREGLNTMYGDPVLQPATIASSMRLTFASSSLTVQLRLDA